MNDDGNLDIKKVIERGTERTTLKDLAQRGFENVKVLNENVVQEMISQAVDRVVTSNTAEERSRILAESRKELDRLLKEQRAIRSRAQLLESDKHELIEQVESLQREIQLKGELEEETLHRRLEQGLASLQSQVEELRGRAQAATREAEAAKADQEKAVAEIGELQKEIGRLTADRDRVEREAEGTLARAERLEKDLAEEQSRARGAEKARTDLVAQILDLQSKAAAAQNEHHGTREEVVRHRAELKRLGQELERERDEAERLRGEAEQLAQRLEGARHDTAGLRGQLQEAERLRSETAKSLAELERLRAENGTLEREAESRRAEAARLEERLREEERKAEAAGLAEAELRTRLAGTETLRTTSEKELGAKQEELARIQAELETARQEAAFLRGQVARQQQDADAQTEAAGLTEVELRARLAAAEEHGQASEKELEAARQEVAFLRGQIAQQQQDTEAQREKTVIVTAELQEIEEKQRTEQQELDRLRADAGRFAEENERLRKDLETGRGEIDALQDLLRREQEAARTAQNESVSLQARHQEVERERDRLRAESEARATTEEAVRLVDLLERARRSSAAARASAIRSREVTAELERTLARQQRPKGRKRGGSIRGGAAFDGMALLDDFFRKIRVKEHFQKHLPVGEQPGRPHPSESMAEVLKAIVAGDGRGRENPRAVPLELVGPTNGPDAAALRQFLGGLSTKAVQSLARVHHGLRLHLSPLPRKPQPLVLDVAPLELGLGRKKGNRRTYQPLVCFDPAAGEFWNSHFRSSRRPAAEGILPFLKACIGRVPTPFARDRIRFRMDSRFFNEAVVRFLDSKGVSYVIQAPATAAVRKAARRCAFTRLSNGWEVGQFLQRLHPIRRTQGRFMVVRRRLSKKAKEAGPGLFRDDRHVYHVFATDRRGTPWRSFELYGERPASLEKAKGLLSGFTTSRLLGRSRRSVAALFQAHLLASDLVQAFRRSCLPAEEKRHGLDELRDDFLMSPSRGLIVLPRRDRRRRLFSRVARLTRRLKPARPFRLR